MVAAILLELIALNARLNIARDRLARIKIVRIGRHDNDGLRRQRWASVAPNSVWRDTGFGGGDNHPKHSGQQMVDVRDFRFCFRQVQLL